MQIGINAHLLSLSNTYRATGVSNYIYYLLSNLSVVDATNRYHVFTGRWAHGTTVSSPLPLGENFRFYQSHLPTYRPTVRALWEQTAQLMHARNLDVLHSPVNVVPLLTRTPRIVTIHDLSFLIHTDKHLFVKRCYLTVMTRVSARRAQMVLTDSEDTRQSVIRLLHIPPEYVRAVPLAASEEFRWIGDTPQGRREIEAFRQQKGLPERYFLYLGTLEPRKNIPMLLCAYAALHKQTSKFRGKGETPPKLVLAGPKGWMYEGIFAQVKELGIEDQVIFPGFVSREEVALWYNAALGFVYLSAHEGFGLPPLQAMACGVPVIVNDASSLPEVVGDAAIKVHAEDCTSVVTALQTLANTPEVCADLRMRGLERAARFSWRHTAERTLDAYEATARRR